MPDARVARGGSVRLVVSTWRSARLRLAVAVVAVAVAPGRPARRARAAAAGSAGYAGRVAARASGGCGHAHPASKRRHGRARGLRVPIPVIEPLPDACLSRYPNGTLVTVTAVPVPAVPGARFDRWSDYRCADEEPVCVRRR